jgi:hypothetical protein
MTLPTTTPVGSTNRRFYNGPIGVAGVGVTQDFDLANPAPGPTHGMPTAIRSDPTFRDNWIVFARQVDPGITNVAPEVEFLPPAGPGVIPTTLRLTLDAANITDEIDIEFIYLHSPIR